MAIPTPTTYQANNGTVRAGSWNHALAQFSATVLPGQCIEYPSSNLNTYDETEGYWFGPTPNVVGATGPMDSAWALCMDVDEKTQQMYFAGGRPQEISPPQKMVWYNAILNEWRSKSNWSGIRGGHMYRSTCVIPEHRLVAYEPAYLTDGIIPLWNINTNTYHGSIPAPPTAIADSSAGWVVGSCYTWHPNMGEQGSIVRANTSFSRVIAFDWALQQWIPIGKFNTTANWTNNHQAGHYVPLMDACIVGAGTASTPKQLLIVNADKSTRLTAPTISNVAANSQGNFVPHPNRKASISLCVSTKRIVSYEFDSDRWVDRAALPSSIDSANIISSTLPHLGIILVAKYGMNGTSKTYVYRPDF
jgi:hypothetical protein